MLHIVIERYYRHTHIEIMALEKKTMEHTYTVGVNSRNSPQGLCIIAVVAGEVLRRKRAVVAGEFYETGV